MAKKNKYYVVWVGRESGIFDSWEACKRQVDGFDGARYMGFPELSEAKIALTKGWQSAYAKKTTQASSIDPRQPRPQGNVVAVDAACSGNPGLMEYRGVYLGDGKEIFHAGPYTDGTNNIGEFLAIVHILALQKQKGLCIPVYSDSANALLWIKKKKCGTKLARTGRNDVVFELIERAELWLQTHQYDDIPLHKWHTEIWGEIPADFGRK